LEATEGTAVALAELRDSLAGLDLGPSEGLIGPLRRARDRFEGEYLRALDTLDRTVVAAEGMTTFLRGPSDYLLLAANNAEMQAGSGMYLQVGLLHVEDGRLELGDLLPASELFVETPSVPLDPDVEARWGALLPNQEWRNLNLSPRFDVTASSAAAMWEAVGGEPVDGVLAVDIAALEALLGVTGPIEVDGTTLGADEVASDLMLGQYVAFEDDRDERRDRLGRVAQATFDALDAREWSPSGLLRALQGAGEGRHLLAWSPDALEQEAWEAIGIDGQIGPRSMLLSVMNRGGNKLDQFLAVYAEIEIEADAGVEGQDGDAAPTHHVQVEVTLVNRSPKALPRYVAGPHPQSPVGEGTYRGYLSLTMPGAAGNQTISSSEIATLGDDGVARVLAAPVVVERGQEVKVTFSFDLPAAQRDLLVEPSARLPAIEWYFGDDNWSDEEPVTIGW
jgi:hypothetical protein